MENCGGNVDTPDSEEAVAEINLSNLETSGKHHWFDSATWFISHVENLGCVDSSLGQV